MAEQDNAGLLVAPEQEALLRSEGIMAKGYGLIPKLVMINTDLSITAKAIYAYLCSLAGGGETAFPSRNNIVHVLGINKDTFYKHFEGLKGQGWVFSEQSKSTSSQFGHNVYKLASKSPVSVETRPADEASQSKLHSKLVPEGIRRAGYGMIPRLVMQDERLTCKAKALYAYFCSFAGAGEVAFPSQSTIAYHLDISNHTYYKLLNQLTEQGYITVRQRKEKGRFAICDYYLNDEPPPFGTFSDTVASDTEKPDTQKSATALSDTVISDTTNNSPITNSPKKNSFMSNSPSISYADWRAAIDAEPEQLPALVHRIDRKTLEEYIAQDIGLDIILPIDSLETRNRVRYLISLVAEALRYPSLRVAGTEHPPDQFIPRLLSLMFEDYQFVLAKVDKVTGVKNLKAYYLSCLYNAHADLEAAIEQEVRADLGL